MSRDSIEDAWSQASSGVRTDDVDDEIVTLTATQPELVSTPRPLQSATTAACHGDPTHDIWVGDRGAAAHAETVVDVDPPKVYTADGGVPKLGTALPLSQATLVDANRSNLNAKRKRPRPSTWDWDSADPGDNSGGFGAYMNAKVQKLRLQFDADFNSRKHQQQPVVARGDPIGRGQLTPIPVGGGGAAFRPEEKATGTNVASANGTNRRSGDRLFVGVTVWVDGVTTPNRDAIRELLGLRGGRLETYLMPEFVTHVVCETLAQATRLRLHKLVAAKRINVVTPKWITDSIAQDKVLPVAQYPVPGMTDPAQRNISSFFRRPVKGASMSN